MKRWKWVLGLMSTSLLIPLTAISCNDDKAQIAQKDQQIADLNIKIKELNIALNNKESDLQALNGTLSKVSSKVINLQAKLKESETTSANLNLQIQDLNSQNTKLNAQIQANLSAIKTYQDKVASLEADLKAQPTKYELSQQKERIKALEQEKTKLEQELAQARESNQSNEAKIAQLNEQILQVNNSKQVLQQDLEDKNNKLTTAQNQLQELKNQVQQLTNTNEQLNTTIAANNETIGKNQATITSLNEQISTSQKALNDLHAEENKLTQQVKQLSEQLLNVQAALNNANKANADLVKQNEKLREEIAKLKQESSGSSDDKDQNKDKVLSTAEIEQYYLDHPNLKQFKLDKQTQGKLENNKAYINSLFNRTFSLIWDFDDGTNTAGTIWLLDYHKESNNKYKLFFATNYHVAVELYSDKDFDFNAQPNRTKKITNIRLGAVKNWTNQRLEYNYKSLERTMWPKNLFLGHNFMDQEVSKLYNGRYYTEFSVIEFDYDIEQFNQLPALDPNLSEGERRVRIEQLKQMRKANSALSLQLNLAIEELNSSIDKFKQGNYAMQNSTLPYAGVDYGSVTLFINNVLGIEEDDTIKLPNTINKINKVSNDIEKYFGNSKLQSQPQWDFFAGYPFVNRSRNQLLYNVQNSMLGSSQGLMPDIDKNYWRTIDWYNGSAIADHGAEFNNEPRSKFYGLAYENLVPNDVIGGASGSLVVNESNLPIGLLFGHSGKQPLINNKNVSVSLEKALTVGYALNMPFYSSKINGYVQPYNIIDGSDKDKYPHQVNSYRETLATVYGPEYKTALFK
ncbi:MIP family Ig-specific serine endopeptidase [Mycoplasma sp. 2634B]|uniref:MIP family Ig-specific serine endopeptidase n=1 Tax=Mycoplasma sp. 2634B TaxID=3401692 RepID=UPI003AAFDFAA